MSENFKQNPESVGRIRGGTIALVLSVFFLLIIVFTAVLVIIPGIRYDIALATEKCGSYAEAAELYEKLGNFKDSKERAVQCREAANKDEYSEATALTEAGEYEMAAQIFAALGDYADSPEKLEEINSLLIAEQYGHALSLYEAGEYSEAAEAFKALGEYMDSSAMAVEAEDSLAIEIIAAAQVGDIVCFGRYEQDGNTENGAEPIEWIVLQKQNANSYLIAKDCIEYLPMNEGGGGMEWAGCSLRHWLNEDFYMQAFSERERECIPMIRLYFKYPMLQYDVLFKDCTDRIYILSQDEMNFQLAQELRPCEGSPYAVNKGYCGENALWWIRCPSFRVKTVHCMNSDGSFSEQIMDPGDSAGVRPLLWVVTEPLC